jgi:predicted sulfurtransferase
MYCTGGILCEDSAYFKHQGQKCIQLEGGIINIPNKLKKKT